MHADIAPTELVRNLLIERVRAVFNDASKGETPVVRSSKALYPPSSVIWRVHGDVTTMMIGGVTALLMQMLHPAALAGVWEHSNFRHDMIGRLRRTARFIALTTFAERSLADAAIDRVKTVHERVRGVLEDGTSYEASDPRLLAWVHVCEVLGFLDAYRAYGEPEMSLEDQDSYIKDAGLIALRLGADPVPQNRAQALEIIKGFMPELRASPRVHQVAKMVLSQPAPSWVATPAQLMLMQAAVDQLPPWAKRLHKRDLNELTRPLIRGGALMMTRTLHWAFEAARRPPTES